MSYIDFAAVKEAVSIEQAIQLIGLKMTRSGGQLRGPCPACRRGGDRALVVTPAKGLFVCFADNAKGGDQIALTAHIRSCSVRNAAEWLSGTVTEPVTVKSNKETVGKNDANSSPSPGYEQARPGFQALDYLDASHAAVEAVGFDQATAEALGIGFAPKGLMKGTVAVPVRLEDGTLAGYIGITEAKLPNRWHLPTTNVIPLPKRTA